MKQPTRFITNEKGERVAVIIDIGEYDKILEELEELDDIRACEEAEASGDLPIPLDQALDEIKQPKVSQAPCVLQRDGHRGELYR